jgi:hypothetical protein
MEQIIATYNPQVLQETPRYIWIVSDASGNPIFHCDYKDNQLIMRMRDIFGTVVFNKAVTPDKVQTSINFCLQYLNEYNNL